MITALTIAFSSSWKLAFIVVCFIPILMFSGIIQGKKQSKVGQSKNNDSFTEQGGQV
jgi:ABC-type bacteriocin/lantibiotic exporter with double-glycine peptidase domain